MTLNQIEDRRLKIDDSGRDPDALPVMAGALFTRWAAAASALLLILAFAWPLMPFWRMGACTFNMLTGGVPCPGCGLTRSVCWTVEGRLDKAFEMNPFGIEVVALAAFLLAAGLLPPLKRRVLAWMRSRPRLADGLIWGHLGVFTAYGLGRIVFVLVTGLRAW